ncbi:ClcB-like voltage-gated chloride channel protein [Paraburkholderia sp. HP33-1]|uniref:ClcB-like voltage-gated chloride channel protein n=1 Tax=Paraburkholderia sp. HP33-1 TaxID=2883243 RepID=UPI001F20E0E9|nr:ClcB-like voltage-gated chloride channel protein [Paraburkholderia sp. HP33-1]
MTNTLTTIQKFRLWLAERLRPEDGYWALLWAVPIGFAGALATVAFREAIEIAQALIFSRSGDPVEIARHCAWYIRLLVPTAGGVMAGALLWTSSRRVSGIDHPEYMEAITIGDGKIPVSVTLIRSLSALSSIASGSSIGREGPMVQLAALAASLMGRARSWPLVDVRTMVACGAAAGIASAYSAPIASAFFVAEIVLGSVVAERMAPLIISSVVANLTMRMLPGYHPPYMLHAEDAINALGPLDMMMFAALGVVLGLSAPLYLALLQFGKKRISEMGMPYPLALGVGGLCVGIISIILPETLGNGYSVVNDLIRQPAGWSFVTAVLIFKVIATAISTGSGAVGGVFTPTIFVGAALGALYTDLATLLHVDIGQFRVLFVIVGMGAFLGAATQAPLMAILMIFEMTLNYEVMLPLMLCTVVAFVCSRSVVTRPMYDATRRINEKRALADRARRTRVRDILTSTRQTLSSTATVEEAGRLFLSTTVKYIYLLDNAEQLVGCIALSDYNQLVVDGIDMGRQPASLIAHHDIPVLYPDDEIFRALQAFLRHEGERLPVVCRSGKKKFLGVVSKADLLSTIESLV